MFGDAASEEADLKGQSGKMMQELKLQTQGTKWINDLKVQMYKNEVVVKQMVMWDIRIQLQVCSPPCH